MRGFARVAAPTTAPRHRAHWNIIPIWTRSGRFAALLLFVLLQTGLGLARDTVFVDAAGRRVEVPERIDRVFAAGPPAAILIYALVPEKLVGWVSRSPPEAQAFLDPRVRDLPVYGRLTGRGGTANVESVLVAKPDLVVDVGATGPTYASLADRLQAQTGIPYILLDGSLAKTPDTVRTLAALTGGDAGLAEEAQRILTLVAERISKVPGTVRPRVYFGRGPKGLETGLAGSINMETLEAAGARNVAAQAGSGGLATISPEQLLAWDPDVILTLDAAIRDRFATDPLFAGIKAVREGRVYRVPDLPFGWVDAPPGINRLIGLRWLAGLLHPALFPEPIGEAMKDFYRRFYHVEPTPAQIEALLAGTGPARGGSLP